MPVHSIAYHPTEEGIIGTGGGDGGFGFWNILRKQRLTTYVHDSNPITAVAYAPSGKTFAFAKGYDWARGLEGKTTEPVGVGLHTIQRGDMVRQ